MVRLSGCVELCDDSVGCVWSRLVVDCLLRSIEHGW